MATQAQTEQSFTKQRQDKLLASLTAAPNTRVLVETILVEAQRITRADGGTLYLFNDKGVNPRLEFEVLKSRSLNVSLNNQIEPIELPPIPLYLPNGEENHHHIAAYVALTKKILNIPDAYASTEFDFSGTKAFDQHNDYRSVSFLTVPLLNHDEDVIGVLQLVNAQAPNTAEVIPFTDEFEPIIQALARYASIALNNLLLVDELKNLLDAFVKVIAMAIDAKSSHTSGHCQRVPVLTEMITQAVLQDKEQFPEFNFDEDDWYELRIAAWLHDCGKLSTPDSVLDKSTKLHTFQDRITEIEARFSALMWQRKVHYLELISALTDAEKTAELKLKLQAELDGLAADLEFLRVANKGGEFMAAEKQQRVRTIAQRTWCNAADENVPLLTTEEVENLCIERGTLSQAERDIINNHIQVTIDMLESLPFPRKLRNVAEYAGGHHEKMDGSGYPRKLTGEQMSIPARVMAVADIFEALTAKDRPYKEPMKISQALTILKRMSGDHIDPKIFTSFVKYRVWETYAKQELTAEQLDVTDITPYL